MELKEFLAEYRWRIIGVLGGIALTTLILTIGFWRTLLLVVVVAACYCIGKYIDTGGDEGLIAALLSLLAKK